MAKAEQGAPSARFTRGPWTMVGPEPYEISPAMRAGVIAAGVREENARLIAAAPDLYEALRGAIGWEAETRARLGLPQLDAPEWAQAGRAAIAKAEGREVSRG